MKYVQLGDFTTQAGAVIPQVRIAYEMWGQQRGNNVILVEHALTGDADACSWWPGLIGPGLVIDTDRYCVICTNVLGGCSGSTGPGTPAPDGRAWGSRFPALCIRDMVAAERQLLALLGIDELLGVIGGSMGGARALEWAAMYPEMAGSACVIATSARSSAWQIGIQTAQICAVEADPDWQNGDYYDTGRCPDRGLGAARRIAHLTYRGERELDARFGSAPQKGEEPFSAYRSSQGRFAVESYLDHQASKLLQRFDAGTYVALTHAVNRHDVGRERGGVKEALASITIPVLVAGVDTDLLYPLHQQEFLAEHLGNPIGLDTIVSHVGHDGFLTETEQLQEVLTHYLGTVDLNGRGEPHLLQEKASGLCSADVGSTRPFADASSAEPYARGQKVTTQKVTAR